MPEIVCPLSSQILESIRSNGRLTPDLARHLKACEGCLEAIVPGLLQDSAARARGAEDRSAPDLIWWRAEGARPLLALRRATSAIYRVAIAACVAGMIVTPWVSSEVFRAAVSKDLRGLSWAGAVVILMSVAVVAAFQLSAKSPPHRAS